MRNSLSSSRVARWTPGNRGPAHPPVRPLLHHSLSWPSNNLHKLPRWPWPHDWLRRKQKHISKYKSGHCRYELYSLTCWIIQAEHQYVLRLSEFNYHFFLFKSIDYIHMHGTKMKFVNLQMSSLKWRRLDFTFS